MPAVAIGPKKPTPLSRSPGERAFDRCLYPFWALLILIVPIAAWNIFIRSPSPRHITPTEAELAAEVPAPLWIHCLPAALGLVLFGYCLWALRGVLRHWHDPRAPVLRVSALGLLVLESLFAYYLVSSVFPNFGR